MHTYVYGLFNYIDRQNNLILLEMTNLLSQLQQKWSKKKKENRNND